MNTQNAGDVLLRSLRKAGPLPTGKAVVGRVLSAAARSLTQSNSQLVASQPSQASTQKALFHRNRRLTPCKRPAAAAGPGTRKRPPASASQAAAAEKTLRDVLMHVQTHGGKMPSQLEADSRKLYFQFRTIQSVPAVSDTAQSLLDEIRSAKGRGVTAGQADAAEKILRDVLMHMRTHDGKMPSRLEADS